MWGGWLLPSYRESLDACCDHGDGATERSAQLGCGATLLGAQSGEPCGGCVQVQLRGQLVGELLLRWERGMLTCTCHWMEVLGRSIVAPATSMGC